MEHDDWTVDSDQLGRRAARAIVMIGSRSDERDLATWCAQIESMLLGGQTDVVTCDVAHLDGPAGTVIHVLVRLQLTARRCGGAIDLFRPPPALVELLRIAGLTDVLPVADPLCVETRRHPQGHEQRRVEEGVDADDGAG